MHQDDADVQRAEHRYVQQDVGEVLVRDDNPIHGNDERLFPELRNVLKNPAQVCQLHRMFTLILRRAPGLGGQRWVQAITTSRYHQPLPNDQIVALEARALLIVLYKQDGIVLQILDTDPSRGNAVSQKRIRRG